jgi:hypothetical protein
MWRFKVQETPTDNKQSFQIGSGNCSIAGCKEPIQIAIIPLTVTPSVLVRVSIPAQTLWPRSKLGRKGFIRLTLQYCCSSPRKSGLELKQVRKQELMQRPWRDVPYWLASPGLLSLLSYRTKTTSPEMVPPTRGLSPLITNWENALQLDLMEAFPQLKVLSLW